jgi:2-keto-4-pentenoate hydratase
MVAGQAIDQRVQVLLDAAAQRHEVDRIDPNGELSEHDAYRLQLQYVDSRVAAGDSVVGLKTGLTSRAKQQTMGVLQPILGHILASSVVPEGEPIVVADLIHPRAEPEIAFVLDKDLEGPVTAAQAARATALVFPAVEIIDSRFRDFKFGLGDVIADNTSAARVVFGSVSITPTEADLRLIGMVYSKNGNVESTASGAAVLNNPWEALAWLARRASDLGRPLKAGQMVLAGALADAVFVKPGDTVRVEFDRMGGLSVSFV